MIENTRPTVPPHSGDKLAEDFQRCVGGLHWIKLYLDDPFYRYMLNEFQVL